MHHEVKLAFAGGCLRNPVPCLFAHSTRVFGVPRPQNLRILRLREIPPNPVHSCHSPRIDTLWPGKRYAKPVIN